MKVTATIILASAASALASTPCDQKAPSAMAAIHKFCSQTSMMVPSNYATKGNTGYDDSTRVSITGNCKPAEWVPQYWCVKQFTDMCTGGGKNGAATHKYGTKGCQHWAIQHSSDGAIG